MPRGSTKWCSGKLGSQVNQETQAHLPIFSHSSFCPLTSVEYWCSVFGTGKIYSICFCIFLDFKHLLFHSTQYDKDERGEISRTKLMSVVYVFC